MPPKRRTADNAVRDLSAEMEAATLLITQLRQFEGIVADDLDDEALAQAAEGNILSDMVEGETGLFEAIDRVIEAISDDSALIAGLKAHEEKMQARRRRLERRNERREWIVGNALNLAHRLNHVNPLVTISFRKGRKESKVDVIDDSKIPRKFWRQAEPEVDKVKIRTALKAGEKIEGVQLVDGDDGHSWKWS